MIADESQKNTSSYAATLAIIATVVYFIVNMLGEAEFGGSLASNPSCYKYLGCTSGFFGYDAIEHFMFGIAGTFVLVYIFQKFPQYSILTVKRWKNFLIIIALIVFLSVLWEFLECTHDIFRVVVLHQPLINLKLNINLLDQPSNIDTMGDLFFGLCGSMVAFCFTKK